MEVSGIVDKSLAKDLRIRLVLVFVEIIRAYILRSGRFRQKIRNTGGSGKETFCDTGCASATQTVRSRRTPPKVFFIDQGDVDIIGCLIGSGLVPEDPAHIPPDKKRTFLYQGSLLSCRNREIVDVIMADCAYNQDTC